MDMVTQGQIFEPFFSTKGDQGTGLGLSQVYGIVKSTNGTITVDSQVGQGSQFNIYIPCNTVRDNKADNTSTHREHLPTGSDTILVVDDEAALGELTSETLKDHGYHVLLTNSAKRALEILGQQPVDRVLTDVIMPEMDGYLLALEIKDLYPDIKIQHISGHNDINNSDPKKHGFPATLKKPLNANDILKRIDELLKKPN